MKKLLIAIVLLLVFGITSAAISLGRGGFGSSGGDVSSGGGGSADVRDTRGVRGSSVDAGSFAVPQGSGSAGLYMLSGNHGGDSSLTSRSGDAGSGGQGNGLSFDGWLEKSAELYARATAPAGNRDSGGDGSRYGYSSPVPSANPQPMGSAGPGTTGGGTATQFSSVLPSSDPDTTTTVPGTGSIAAVPEPETYAMLLAGLGLVAAVARRRKSSQS